MSIKSKVMLFSHICDPDRMTGAEKWLLLIAKFLTRQYDVVLVVPQYGKLLLEAEANQIRTVITDYPLLWSLYQSSPAMHQELANIMATDSYRSVLNLLHMHQPDWIIVNTSVNVLPAVAAKEIGLPVLWIVNEIINPGVHQTEAIQMINRYSDWIVGISESVLVPFHAPFIADKKRLIFPTWNDADMHPEKWGENRRTLRAAYQINDRDILVGSVSAMLSPHKGIDQFIHMAGLLMPKFPQMKFLIAGSRELVGYVEECQQLALATPDPSRILFHSFESRIDQLYPGLDIIVVPSMIDEGFGMTALEGFAFGKPVVAYSSGGLAEVLTNTGNGQFLVQRGDVNGLSQTIVNLLQNETMMKTKGMENRLAAERAFGSGIFQNRFDSLLQQIDVVVNGLKHQQPAKPSHLKNGSLIKGTFSFAVFLLENGVKRPFANADAMARYLYTMAEVLTVSEATLQLYPTGRILSTEEPFEANSPANMLLIGSGRTVYVRRDDVLHPVESLRALKKAGYDPNRIVKVSNDVIARFKLGSPIRSSPSRRKRVKRRIQTRSGPIRARRRQPKRNRRLPRVPKRKIRLGMKQRRSSRKRRLKK